MKKLSCFLVAMLFLLMPALQSCDDNDGSVSYTHLTLPTNSRV